MGLSETASTALAARRFREKRRRELHTHEGFASMQPLLQGVPYDHPLGHDGHTPQATTQAILMNVVSSPSMASTSKTWYKGIPNEINPAFDFHPPSPNHS